MARQSTLRGAVPNTPTARDAAWRHPLLLVALLMILAVALGGGGVRYGLNNLAVQLGAFGVLAVHRDAFFRFWRNSPIVLRVLVGLTLLIPILQLVPVPESVWSALPGRDLVAQSLAIVEAGSWRSTSVDPARTLVALTGLLLPLVILAVGWAIPRRHLMTIGWVVVALGLVSFAIGILQVLGGGNTVVFYPERGPTGLLYGTFANRNSAGLFLVAALTLAALLPLPLARPHPAGLPVRLGICALLLLAVILTRSRTAFVLAAIPIALGALRGISAWRGARALASDGNRSSLLVFGAIALSLAALASVVVIAPGRVGSVVERFEARDDARVYIWQDAAYSAERFWPVGAGMGAFDEVYQVDESLEFLTERRAGRAHNDYLELAIEAGIGGLALAAIWLLLVGWLAWRAGRSQLRWPAWGGAAILLSIALQSITDYPLRNQSLLALAAFAMLLLARIADDPEREGQR
ncbi:O-antigen ligase [Erythrobacter sp. JK5]|uniref:O-antigen ligase family protein n=1 Tax=Erythrobacter sp. JK5 TaxID=2829500 RepID=UPI001BA81F3A|nr:O-antigen ligase family protein [Erythrobacter sp. JK5]QUL37650.1 O-antigen ligase family protein [Erythrobacter sp. JK5]